MRWDEVTKGVQRNEPQHGTHPILRDWGEEDKGG